MKNFLKESFLIAISQLVSIFSLLRYREEYILPLSTTESFSYSITLIIGITLVTYLILFLAKWKLALLIKAMGVLGLFFMNFATLSLLIYSDIVFSLNLLLPMFSAAAFITFLMVKGFYSNLLKIICGGGFSAALIITFGSFFPLIFVVLLAVYDLWSVYKGPLKKFLSAGKLGEESERSERGYLNLFLVNLGEVQIGMGDIISYSLMASLPFKYLQLPLAPLPLISFYVGLALLRKEAEKKGVMPGLPLPTLFWLILFIPLIFFS